MFELARGRRIDSRSTDRGEDGAAGWDGCHVRTAHGESVSGGTYSLFSHPALNACLLAGASSSLSNVRAVRARECRDNHLMVLFGVM